MNPPFGYKKVQEKHCLDRDPFLCLTGDRRECSKAEIARDIIETFISKQTLRLAIRAINQKYGIQIFAHNTDGHQKGGRIAQQLFRFSPAGLRNWLLNPTLQGHLSYLKKREIYYNTHESEKLITPSEAAEIKQILDRNKCLKKWSSSKKYPLSGLVFCANCRSACYSVAASRGKTPGYNHYYQCKNWRTRACSNKRTVRMEVIEDDVVQRLTDRSAAIALIASSADEIVSTPELQQLRSQLLSLEQLGQNRAIETAKIDLRRQIEDCMHSLQHDRGTNEGNRELLLRHFSSTSFWRTLPPEDKQLAYRKLIQRVTILDGQVVDVILNV